MGTNWGRIAFAGLRRFLREKMPFKMPTEITTLVDLQTLVTAGVTDWKPYGDVGTDRDGDLLIFNYTPKAQYATRLNFFERVSRGLIVHRKTGEIVARPFDKFYNF